jgi:flagellar biogenesis protein FliO
MLFPIVRFNPRRDATMGSNTRPDVIFPARPVCRLRTLICALAATVVAFGLGGPSADAADRNAPRTVVTADYLEQPATAGSDLTSGSRPSQTRTPIRRTDGEPSDAGSWRRPTSPTTTLALLGAVLAGAYIVLAWMKRRGPGQESADPEAIDVLCSRRLDGQASLHLVRIGRKVLAVGSTATDVRTLAVIEDPEEIALLINDGREDRRSGSAATRNRLGNRGIAAAARRDRHTSSPPSADPLTRRTQ